MWMNQVPSALVRSLHSKWPILCRKLALGKNSYRMTLCMVSQARPAANSKAFRPYFRIPMRFKAELQEVISEHQERISELAKLMKCDRGAVELLVQRDSRVVTFADPEKVDEIIRLVMEHGFTAVDIVTNPRVLMRRVGLLQERLPEMARYKRYRFQLHHVVVSETEFRRYMEENRRETEAMGDCSSRLSFAARLLGCREEEVQERVLKDSRKLVSLPPSALKERVDLIKSYGFTGEDILTNSIILRCPAVEAADRLELIAEQGVLTKERIPFILTNSRNAVFRAMMGWVADKKALAGRENSDALLRERLQISQTQLEEVKRKSPILDLLHPRRLGPCLDVLLGELELPPLALVQKPTLLYYSPRRLRHRASILHSVGIFNSRLLVRELTLTEEKFSVKYADYLHIGDNDG